MKHRLIRFALGLALSLLISDNFFTPYAYSQKITSYSSLEIITVCDGEETDLDDEYPEPTIFRPKSV